MSGADDQRAAEPATPEDRLRTILDDVTAPRDMREDLQVVLDRAAEVDRLRAELADCRAAGDTLADATDTLVTMLKQPDWRGDALQARIQAAAEQAQAWRSATGTPTTGQRDGGEQP